MSENVYLINEINEQRKECHALRQKIKQNQMVGTDDGVMGEGGYDGDLGRELKM